MNSLEDFKDDALQRISKLEEKTDGQDKRLVALESDNKLLTKIATIVESQAKRDEKQEVQMERHHETLVKINENMSNLNTSLQKLDGRVETLEKVQSDNKVTEWFKGVFKDLFFKIVPALIVAYLLYRWNIK
jgi:3-methyladenine DNA glycosylase/8-oxoguanine DNA glycosylase